MSYDAQCQNCDWRGAADDTLEIKDLYQRVAPGEPMPVGECPECGALCQPAGDAAPLCGCGARHWSCPA